MTGEKTKLNVFRKDSQLFGTLKQNYLIGAVIESKIKKGQYHKNEDKKNYSC